MWDFLIGVVMLLKGSAEMKGRQPSIGKAASDVAAITMKMTDIAWMPVISAYRGVCP
ncbi:hypothetical protein GCM10010082_26600 [Kushneria pakistanensis]|uniref:Uncharacterized protein n=1 Tax=Kushneria pakistanensis TaxID=1508770 RepID=A0ABQ3FMY9_9GAMM|nr:hypothetical protein GCM10010082_26600 [Kushneria pakistanensis]